MEAADADYDKGEKLQETARRWMVLVLLQKSIAKRKELKDVLTGEPSAQAG